MNKQNINIQYHVCRNMSQSKEDNNSSLLNGRKWVSHSKVPRSISSEEPIRAPKPEECLAKLIAANKAALEKHKSRLAS